MRKELFRDRKEFTGSILKQLEDVYQYYIFSKGGFTDGLFQAQERGKVRLITLEDLYK